MENRKLVCLQIHNDYQTIGGETKTAYLIADLLESNGIQVIRYYKTNRQYIDNNGAYYKIKNGLCALYNPETAKELNTILDKNHVDFALVHNVVSVISNAAYKVLLDRKVPIIKYLQNYNLVCLNGALNHGEMCIKCQRNNMIGVRCKCYKNSTIYSFIKYLIKRDMDKHILDRLSAFMPNSEFVMKEHAKRGIDGSKMHIMYNYVSIPQTIYEGTRDYFLYYGRLTGEKGVMTTITAFEKMPSNKLVIMGSGTLEDEIRRRTEKVKNIMFVGKCEGKELFEYVAGAKAVVVPSEWDEPLPRTILEAYSQGTPVIGANRGGIPELIEEGKTGYVFESGSISEMVSKIKQFEEMNEAQYMAMRINCIEKLKSEYSEQSYFQRFMECIKSFL